MVTSSAFTFPKKPRSTDIFNARHNAFFRVKKKKSIILLSVIIIFITLAIAGTSLASFFLIVNSLARNHASSTKAFYLAEAGLSHAIFILRNQAGLDEVSGKAIGPVTLGEGTYTVEVDFNREVITSTGTVEGINRTIQLKYRPL